MNMGQHRETNQLLEEEGFRSQEIFTQEKYLYLYYQGLRLLEFFYENGITHGHINAKTLRISDMYTFGLTDFLLSTCTPIYKTLSEQEQTQVAIQARGFNKATVSKEFIDIYNSSKGSDTNLSES